MRKNIYRKNDLSTKGKAYSCLAISEINKTVLYMYRQLNACSLMVSYYINRADQ